MKLDLVINGVPGRIEILSPAPDCRFRFGDAGERQANVESPEPGAYSILIDGRSYEARIEEHPGILVAVIDGFRFEIEIRDPRRLVRRYGAGGGQEREIVCAPMPGKVVKVLAAAGDAVEAGQGLLVVEAMKMQNELKAGRAGKVIAISVKEGATVAAGEPLAVIE